MVRLIVLVSTVDLVPLRSSVLTLLGSVAVGWLTIRARVTPLAVGWLLLVGGVRESAGWADPCGLLHNSGGNQQRADRGGRHGWLWLDHRSQHTAPLSSRIKGC